MGFAPFGGVLPLIVFNGDFDIPQDFLGYIADGSTQGVHALRCIEIEYRQKILVVQIFGSVDPAAGHDTVRCADGKGVLERGPYVLRLIIGKIGVFGADENIIFVILIIAR